MKREFGKALFAVVLLGTATSAFAGSYGKPEEPEEGPAPVAVAPAAEPASPGYWYLGAGALFSAENFHCDADNAWGYNVRAGRRVNDLFAVEAEWEHPVSEFDDAQRVDAFGRLDGDVEAWNLTANGKLYPITGNFQPYALAGLGYGQANLANDQNDGFIARFGVGLDALITDNVGVSAEVGYVVGSGELANYDQVPVSLGFFYNFR